MATSEVTTCTTEHGRSEIQAEEIVIPDERLIASFGVYRLSEDMGCFWIRRSRNKRLMTEMIIENRK